MEKRKNKYNISINKKRKKRKRKERRKGGGKENKLKNKCWNEIPFCKRIEKKKR